MVDEVQTQTEDYIEIKIPKQEESEKAPEAKKESPTKKKTAKKNASSKKKVAKPITPKKSASKKKASKPTKKDKRKKSVKKQVKQQNNALWAALLIIGLIVIGVVIYLSLRESMNLDDEKIDDRVAALVNGEAIYLSEVDDLYAKLPDSTKITTSKDDVLDQLIEQKVLIQEAENLGIEATDEEVQNYIDDMLAYFGFTQEQLEQVLAQQNVPMEDFIQSTEEQVVLAKLINESILMNIEISDELAEEYYENNTVVFTTPESVVIKHILVTTDMNTTAEDVVEMIDEDKENFCDLVTEYSQDTGSIASCGEYRVAQNGQFDPEFEEAAFEMDVDDVVIVATDYGNHIMWKIEELEEGVESFDDVKEKIKTFLAQQQSSEEVPAYIASLRDEASIEIYSLEEDVATPQATTPAAIEVEVEAEEEREVVVEDTKPARTDSFGECLADLDAKLYGVDWAPGVEEQKELLGDAFEQITYVDCDKEDCTGITVYPTWVFGQGADEFVLKGKQSLNSLERETGCISA